MTSAFQYIRSAAAPGTFSPENTRDFPCLVTLNGRRIGPPLLVCRWYRDIEGRLSCVWTQVPTRPQSG
jgi:hypothetical protein